MGRLVGKTQTTLFSGMIHPPCVDWAFLQDESSYWNTVEQLSVIKCPSERKAQVQVKNGSVTCGLHLLKAAKE